jgi:anthranilate phosphoribosyltransferase
VETVAGALADLGTEHALVVSSEDGIDELSVSAPTTVLEVRGGRLERYTVAPADFGLETADADMVPSGTPEQNAEVARRIFAGEPGPARDLAVLNAGAAIYAAGRAETLGEGVEQAQEAIDSGAAAASVDAFIKRTQEMAPQEAPA